MAVRQCILRLALKIIVRTNGVWGKLYTFLSPPVYSIVFIPPHSLQFSLDEEYEVVFARPIRRTKRTGYQKRVRVGLVDSDGTGTILLLLYVYIYGSQI